MVVGSLVVVNNNSFLAEASSRSAFPGASCELVMFLMLQKQSGIIMVSVKHYIYVDGGDVNSIGFVIGQIWCCCFTKIFVWNSLICWRLYIYLIKKT